MPLDSLTYWRGTFTARSSDGRSKVTKVYTIGVPKSAVSKVQELAGEELAPIFQKHGGSLVTKPLGGFVQVTHPERMHDRLSGGGYPVWLETRSRH